MNADVLLGARIRAWALVLPFAKHVVPLRLLARVMWARRRGPADGARRRRAIELSAQMSRMPIPRPRNNCLERSLLAYRYLSHAGAHPRLVAGMRRSGGALGGHVWVLLDGAPVHDDPAELRDFVEVVAFADGGHRAGAAAA